MPRFTNIQGTPKRREEGEGRGVISPHKSSSSSNDDCNVIIRNGARLLAYLTLVYQALGLFTDIGGSGGGGGERGSSSPYRGISPPPPPI